MADQPKSISAPEGSAFRESFLAVIQRPGLRTSVRIFGEMLHDLALEDRLIFHDPESRTPSTRGGTLKPPRAISGTSWRLCGRSWTTRTGSTTPGPRSPRTTPSSSWSWSCASWRGSSPRSRKRWRSRRSASSARRCGCSDTGPVYDRGTSRTGLVDAGERVERFMTESIRGVKVADVECDEVWGFVGQKEKTKRQNGVEDPQQGDSYAWIAVERNSKLVLCCHVGRRDVQGADAFAEKLDRATAGRFTVGTDAFDRYVESLHYHIGARSDYGIIRKEFGYEAEGQRYYSPPALSRPP